MQFQSYEIYTPRGHHYSLFTESKDEVMRAMRCGEAGGLSQGGSGTTVPGGVQELWRCGTEGCGHGGGGLGVDYKLLQVFSNLSNSMILTGNVC